MSAYNKLEADAELAANCVQCSVFAVSSLDLRGVTEAPLACMLSTTGEQTNGGVEYSMAIMKGQ